MPKKRKNPPQKNPTSLFWGFLAFWVFFCFFFFCISDVFPGRFLGLRSLKKPQNRLKTQNKNLRFSWDGSTAAGDGAAAAPGAAAAARSGDPGRAGNSRSSGKFGDSGSSGDPGKFGDPGGAGEEPRGAPCSLPSPLPPPSLRGRLPVAPLGPVPRLRPARRRLQPQSPLGPRRVRLLHARPRLRPGLLRALPRRLLLLRLGRAGAAQRRLPAPAQPRRLRGARLGGRVLRQHAAGRRRGLPAHRHLRGPRPRGAGQGLQGAAGALRGRGRRGGLVQVVRGAGGAPGPRRPLHRRRELRGRRGAGERRARGAGRGSGQERRLPGCGHLGHPAGGHRGRAGLERRAAGAGGRPRGAPGGAGDPDRAARVGSGQRHRRALGRRRRRHRVRVAGAPAPAGDPGALRVLRASPRAPAASAGPVPGAADAGVPLGPPAPRGHRGHRVEQRRHRSAPRARPLPPHRRAAALPRLALNPRNADFIPKKNPKSAAALGFSAGFRGLQHKGDSKMQGIGSGGVSFFRPKNPTATAGIWG